MASLTSSRVPPGGLNVRWRSLAPTRAGMTLTSASRSPWTIVADTVRVEVSASAGGLPVRMAVTTSTATAMTTSVATERHSGAPSSRRATKRRLPHPRATSAATKTSFTSRVRP